MNTSSDRRRRRAARIWLRVLPWASVVLFLLSWELLVWLRDIPPIILPAPSAIANDLFIMIADGSLPYHLGITFLRIISGFALAAATGVLLGVLMGRSTVVNALLDPWIAALYPLPKISLI